MSNIWDFLYQTVSVSLAALFILLLRKIFDGKLSPRFMCGVWLVLALRILIPASVKRNIILPTALLCERIKSTCESLLSSAYSGEYAPISVSFPFPYVTGAPKSATDWVFIVYIAGIFAFLLFHAASYLRLRLLLKKACGAGEENFQRVRAVCEKYGLKPCRAVEAQVETAFVCGVFRPVLVLPEGKETDEKVILHEMLHLKYKDVLFGVIWCVLRALHWCNPFSQCVFSLIENDTESLCDYRVLELLSGEERREYGKILLCAANEKYARAVGTSSVSNGGRNVSRRIANIVRFKKYPRGMALVSVCIVIIVGVFSVVGTAAEFDSALYNPQTPSDYNASYAMARLNRCTTAAGALDTFAKAKIYSNPVYLAMCSPIDMHESIIESTNAVDADLLYARENFSIVNMIKTGKDTYSAYVAINLDFYPDSNGDYTQGAYYSSVGSGSLFIPVTVYKENGWVVEETGERVIFEMPYYGGNVTPPVTRKLAYEAECGALDLNVFTRAEIDNSNGSFGAIWNGIAVKTPQTGVDIESSTVTFEGTFKFNNKELFADKKYVAVVIGIYDEDKESAVLPQEVLTEIENDTSSQGAHFYSGVFGSAYEWYRYSWSNAQVLYYSKAPKITFGNDYSLGYSPYLLPRSYNVWIIADGEIIEEFTVEVAE